LQTVKALDTICEKLETYPEILQSDNGAEFKNKAMKEWATANDVRLVNTTSYTPQANGLIEISMAY
jgi:transposase InsO family protein